MANIIKKNPSYGDIAVLINGKKRFVDAREATSDFINSLQCIGVVYDVQGKLVRIVGGVNNQSKQWSCVADFEITAIPSESGDYEVKLLNAVVGNFTYTKSEGTIAEFADQLNDWLAENAPKWEAYTRGGHSYLQMKTYDAYENTCTIAGTTLVKLIGSEVADYTISTGGRNHVKQYTTYNGMCRARLEAYVKNNADANCNPTTEMNGTTQLFATFPCSLAYYNGELGGGLHTHFTTYSEYLDACMVISEDLDKGVMKFRDGKLMTSLLKDKTILKAGNETYAYTAARYAHDYNAGVEGFGAGEWWLPSMYELSLLMAKIGNADNLINNALAKHTGWSQIGITSSRWSCSRYSSISAWSYYSYGITTNYNFYYSFAVSVVSAFYLDD